jgi:secreted PhoX family phosphatase
MAVDVTRRRFVQGSAAVGGGLVLAGPLSALAAQTAQGRRPSAAGYGPLRPAPELDTGITYLALPAGFKYRLISRAGDPMDDGNPTPGIFDGMAAYSGPNGTTVLIRNHENRSRAGEVTVAVPAVMRYDPDQNTRGGNTKVVVGKDRRAIESFAVLGGTHTNCAGGETPWGTWITCEEIFNYGSVENNVAPGTGVPHGYCFEVPADATGPVKAEPIIAAGRFSHEAVAWLDGVLYETEDRGNAAFYRFVPNGAPAKAGDLAALGGALEALKVVELPNFDADDAEPGESYAAEWVTIDEPNPPADTVRTQAQAKGAAIFNRTEGIWSADGRVYLDCTTGGDSGLGQLWEYAPEGEDGGTLRLVYESTSANDLQNPDNLVVVPHTEDVWLQEDGAGEQFVRGVTPEGAIYDFARTIVSDSEFCGGCFSPNGHTFFLNQQGERLATGETAQTQPDAARGLTFAIWGAFDR